MLLTFDDFHDYQVRAIAESFRLKQAGLFLETGLGKTIIGMTLFDQYRKRNMVRKCLVVGPKKVIYNVWRQEAQEWGHTKDYKFNIIHGDAGRGSSQLVKLRALMYPADIYLINYEGLPWLSRTLTTHYLNRGKGIPFDMVIYDESTKMKHSTTQRFYAWKKFNQYIGYRFAASGNPMPNGYIDLFGQMWLVDLGQSLGSTITSYRQRFFYSINVNETFQVYKPRPGAEKQIQERVRDRVIYMRKTDYLNLPPVIYKKLEMDLPPALRKTYDELESDLFTEVDDGVDIEVFNESSKAIKLRQLLSGAVYTPVPGNKKERKVIGVHKERIDMLKSMVDSTRSHKPRMLEEIGNCIIAYQFQFERDLLRLVFPKAPAIDSRTTEAEASNIIIKWKKGLLPAMLVNSASVSHGLNLQKGGFSLLWFSLTYNYEHFSQLIDRLWRQGQEAKAVFVYVLLFRDTIDVDVLNALIEKYGNEKGFKDAMRNYRKTRLKMKV